MKFKEIPLGPHEHYYDNSWVRMGMNEYPQNISWGDPMGCFMENLS